MSWPDDEWSYTDTFKFIKWLIAAIVLLAVFWFVMWKFDWWLYEETATRKADINAEVAEESGGTQQRRAEQVRNLIKDFNIIDRDNTAGRNAIRNDACDLIARLDETFIDEDIQEFTDAECS